MKQLLAILLFMCSANVIAQNNKQERFETTGPQKGFKILVEGGYGVGSGLYGEERISFMASIGYRFNPFIYAGVGSGENYFTSSEKYGIPLYATIRANFLNIGVSPYFDVKVGYSIADVKGLYLAPSVGCRWGFTDNIAFTASMGYELQRTDCYTAIIDLNNPNDAIINNSKRNLGALNIKIGFEF